MIERFHYEDASVRAVCETAARFIRERSTELLRGIVAVGEQLVKVKEVLPHGQWGDWLGYQFNMSMSTAENYMNAFRAVTQYPELRNGYDPSVLYLFTRSLPESAARDIIKHGPVSREEAQCLINEAKGNDWYADMKGMVDEDPGVAYRRIEWAMKDENLRPYAEMLLEQHSHEFAHLSDRAKWEVEKEMGVTVLDRVAPMKEHIPSSLHVIEGDGTKLQLWVNGAEPEDIVILPRVSAAGQAWQRSIMEILLNSSLRLRTADDVVEVEL